MQSLLRFLGKHFVPIVFVFKYKNKEHNRVVSAFMISIDGQSFLITAGHCLREIEKMLDVGVTIEACYLADGLGEQSKYKEGIPFLFERDLILWFENDDTIDYGVIGLRQSYVNLLHANKVEPLDEQMWDTSMKAQTFAMLGVPLNRISSMGETIAFEPSLYSVIRLAPQDLPSSIKPVSTDHFYGEIGDDGESIDGTSGGPIFGFARPSQSTRYSLVALQSKWYPKERIIVGRPMQPFVAFLCDLLRGKVKA